MSNGNLPLTTVEKIAQQLEGDMCERGRRPGDRYLTAAEASALFKVNSMTIDRAMRSLAGREMLVRKRSRGTVVGPKFNSDPSSKHNSNRSQRGIDVLHLVVAIDYHRTQNFSSDTLVDEFSQAIPGVTIQVHHLAFLTHARWRLGDHRMIDAATELLGAAGVQLDAVKIRSVAAERESVRELVREMLEFEKSVDAP